MSTQQPDAPHQAFQNIHTDFKEFKGTLLSSKDIKNFDFKDKNVAVIGIDQDTATQLNHISH